MALVAVFGTVVGAMVTLSRELLANWLGRRAKKEEQDEKASLTLWQELRGELNDLRKELDQVRGELDLWKGKYWALMDEHMALKAQHMTLQSELNELRQLVHSTQAAN